MKRLAIFLLQFAIAIISCNSNKQTVRKISDKMNCYLTARGDTICLNIKENPDTSLLNGMIQTATKKILIVFTGWTISPKTILHEDNLENFEILKELQKYSIFVLYVDDRRRLEINDSLSIGQRNMIYQGNHFNSVVQPQYIIYSGGEKKCEEFYFGKKAEKIIEFLQKCGSEK